MRSARPGETRSASFSAAAKSGGQPSSESAFGRDIGDEDGTVHTIWVAVRWPLGLAIAAFALAGLLRHAPRRRQPRLSWLAFGATVGVLCWVAVTLLFGVLFSASSSFGETYGPLAGIVALQLGVRAALPLPLADLDQARIGGERDAQALCEDRSRLGSAGE